MKRVVLVVLLLAVVGRGDWLADHYPTGSVINPCSHSLISSMLVIGANEVLGLAGFQRTARLWVAPFIALQLGGMKEAWDMTSGGRFDWRDVAADAAGVGIGTFILWRL